MSITMMYLLFAVTTSLTSLYELVMPVVQLRKSENLQGLPSYLVYPIFFLVNIVAAPAVFLSCIIPSFSERFRKTLYKSLYED